jgi:hypothetical protein
VREPEHQQGTNLTAILATFLCVTVGALLHAIGYFWRDWHNQHRFTGCEAVIVALKRKI